MAAAAVANCGAGLALDGAGLFLGRGPAPQIAILHKEMAQVDQQKNRTCAKKAMTCAKKVRNPYRFLSRLFRFTRESISALSSEIGTLSWDMVSRSRTVTQWSSRD